jgi:hypothetical protein
MGIQIALNVIRIAMFEKIMSNNLSPLSTAELSVARAFGLSKIAFAATKRNLLVEDDLEDDPAGLRVRKMRVQFPKRKKNGLAGDVVAGVGPSPRNQIRTPHPGATPAALRFA